MSRAKSQLDPWIARLQENLRNERYSRSVLKSYTYLVRRFLRELEHRDQALESVSPGDVETYVEALRRKCTGKPLSQRERWRHGAAIHMVLRLVHGKWPPVIMPTTPEAIEAREAVARYDAWLELRGLSTRTRHDARVEAHQLLKWINDRGANVASVSIADMDAYVAWRADSKSRGTIAQIAYKVRRLLRFLHGAGQMPADLAPQINGPRIYALEGIPSTIRPDDLDRVLAEARRDHSVMGRRDYAILMLLATYGLRGGEILKLHLSDIDWRHERLRIRRTKTGVHSELPLMRAPADALLDYLKHARPRTTVREVFLRARAPYRMIDNVSALTKIIARKCRAADVELSGKRGAHIFRHGRAVSLLRGGVPIKVIGDVLGHRSERSTGVYLKLATEDLRSVALDVPSGVSP